VLIKCWKVTENALGCCYCIAVPSDPNDTPYAEEFQTCGSVLSQSLQSNNNARPTCWRHSEQLAAVRQLAREGHQGGPFLPKRLSGHWGLNIALCWGEANTCSVVHKPHTQSFAGPPVTKWICPLTYLANTSTIVGNFGFDFRSRTLYLYLPYVAKYHLVQCCASLTL
jgi:hypothetical protein